jgi:hypothetical protein
MRQARGVKVTAFAVLLSTVAAASGGLGSTGLPDPRGPSAEAEALATMLASAATNPAREGEIEGISRHLGLAARRDGVDTAESFACAFPEGNEILAMLALDRDVDDFMEAGEGSSKAARHYREAADDAARMRPLRQNYSRLFASAWRAIAPDTPPAAKVGLSKTGLAALSDRGAISKPPLRDLAYSQPYALDVFFTDVETRGAAEIGPRVYALEGGIVVAAARDWKGGAGSAKWEGGGLSPSSGNGVVVYSPGSNRYYSYFHFSEVAVDRGQVVAAGELLGRGGNTGANARKPGHGGHVHAEMFDMDEDRALSAREIRALLF